jgi:hypothetical protein
VDSLARYYGVHDELLLVPIEELSPRGMSPAHRKRLEETGRLPVGWVELFDRAFSLYWERAGELATRAPRYWFPPRLQHVCVCTAPGRIRPYFQPINRSSWLVELSDFDPENSNEEFATYQLFHAERMGLLKEVSGAVVLNLSYWLVRSGEEIARFQEACRNVPRSDANAFRALADALAWIPQFHHETLRPLRIITPEKPLEVPRSGLLLPRRLEPDFRALLREWTDRPKEVMAVFYRTYAARDPLALRAFRSWLEGEAPRLLVTVGDGKVAWDPDIPERTTGLEWELEARGGETVRSIHADLQTIDDRSKRFRASLRSPDALPAVDPRTEQSGLSYAHVERGLIAYNLDERGMERRRVPAPPSGVTGPSTRDGSR